jgi:antitoxin (DNA-binding transcriptional repressor) of toxin-antitoxin stability system
LVNFLAIFTFMRMVATNEAKTHLSALLQEVGRGVTIVIARGRKPLAKLVPYDDEAKARPKVGETLDAPMTVPEAALRPLEGEELRAWGLR